MGIDPTSLSKCISTGGGQQVLRIRRKQNVPWGKWAHWNQQQIEWLREQSQQWQKYNRWAYANWQPTCSATLCMTWRICPPVKVISPMCLPDTWERYNKCYGHELNDLSRHSSPVFQKLHSVWCMMHSFRAPEQLGRDVSCTLWN